MTSEAIKYTLGCIADVAFPLGNFTVEALPVPSIVVDNRIVVRFPVPEEEMLGKLFNKTVCYSEVNAYDCKVKVKVFGLPQGKPLFSLSDACVVVNADLITISFALLSRAEEILVDERDKYGRFSYINSISNKYNIIDIPIVDEYAFLLRKYVVDNFPSVSVSPRDSRFVPTHDIDFLFRFPNFFKSIRTIAGDLFVRKSLRKSLVSLRAYVRSRRKVDEDPYVSGLLNLVKVSIDNNLNSCFYFKALSGGDDCSYDINSNRTKECIAKVSSCGMTVGLHGGLSSYSSAEDFAEEKKSLQFASGSEIVCSRQHFLKFDVRVTPSVWQDCGVMVDSTLGFPEHEGFRCGTCHPYRLYDVGNDCVTNVVEQPLIVMDTTLFQYRKLTEAEAYENICRLYERCMAVEGDFVMLWHNTTMFGELKSWYENIYLRFVQQYCAC